jgi:hypothetical protein
MRARRRTVSQRDRQDCGVHVQHESLLIVECRVFTCFGPCVAARLGMTLESGLFELTIHHG